MAALRQGLALLGHDGEGFTEEVTFLKERVVGLPGGPVVKTSPSNAGAVGSIPGRGAKIPHASGPKKPKHKKTEPIL